MEQPSSNILQNARLRVSENYEKKLEQHFTINI